jgi:hypothetical protein
VQVSLNWLLFYVMFEISCLFNCYLNLEHFFIFCYLVYFCREGRVKVHCMSSSDLSRAESITCATYFVLHNTCISHYTEAILNLGVYNVAHLL